ncbi:MAG: hypothetical protein JRI45_10225 [Deltaproteobacteria bacterium]|nr:hypothetical protein [Deltaproteobacteria bacterium]
MVREERIKILRQVLTGASDTDAKTNPNAINGKIEQISVLGTGVEYDLNITPSSFSGLSAQSILDVQATGDNVFYPRATVEKNDGTDAAAGDNKWGHYVVADQLDFNASVLATGSEITVRVYYI